MEEDEYKSTYGALTSVRCVFEKTLTNHRAKCSLSKHFCLSDREGYSCKDAESSLNCAELLEKLRKKSLFVLKLRDINGPLPHNMEIRVQIGGLRGLRAVLDPDEKESLISDIRALIEQAQKQYDNMDALPYNEIVQSIASFKTQRHGKSKQSRDTD